MLAFLFALAVGVAPSTTGAGSAALVAKDGWQVDYGDSQCTALRSYPGDDDSDLVIGFIPAPRMGAAQIVMVRRARIFEPQQRVVQLSGPGGPVTASMMNYPAKKGGKTVSRIGLTPEQYAAVARNGDLRVRFKDSGQFDKIFALTNLPRVTTELEKCTAGLRDLWAMGPAQEARIKIWAKPKGAMSKWFTSNDYPRQAYIERNTGVVNVRLMIDEVGAVKQCVPVESSGSAVLDAMTCYIFEHRGKFSPAMDE